jgi:hypothetical protein
MTETMKAAILAAPSEVQCRSAPILDVRSCSTTDLHDASKLVAVNKASHQELSARTILLSRMGGGRTGSPPASDKDRPHPNEEK